MKRMVPQLERPNKRKRKDRSYSARAAVDYIVDKNLQKLLKTSTLIQCKI